MRRPQKRQNNIDVIEIDRKNNTYEYMTILTMTILLVKHIYSLLTPCNRNTPGCDKLVLAGSILTIHVFDPTMDGRLQLKRLLDRVLHHYAAVSFTCQGGVRAQSHHFQRS